MTELVNLGNSGLLVSRLGLGTFNFGNTTVGVDEAAGLSMIDAYLAAGHNYIDTANVYGDTRAESIVGKALKGRRDDVVLATKAGGPYGSGAFETGTSRKALYQALEGSLRRLDSDHIDLYQMHVYDHRTPLAETLSTLNDFVRQGKVRYIGVSNWTAAQIMDACRLSAAHGWEPIVSLQPQYSLLQREIEVDIIAVCRQFGMAVLPWSPLAGGLLSGMYRKDQSPPQTGRMQAFPQLLSRLNDRSWSVIELVCEEAANLETTPVALSVAWLLSKPEVTAPLTGPENVSQLEENLAALELRVPEEVLARLDASGPPVAPYPHNFGRRR